MPCGTCYWFHEHVAYDVVLGECLCTCHGE